jgi:fatty-acyl-CoA synthase
MAALVAAPELDLRAFKTHLVNRLPGYARPIFLRLRAELDVTATFKHKKSDLVRDGYDPDATSDLIYFSDPDSTDFVRLDKQLFDRIQAGQIRF